MKSSMFGLLLASLGAFTLGLAADEAFAGSQGKFRASFASTSHRPFAHRNHRHRSQDAFAWPGSDDGFYGPNAQDVPLTSGPAGGIPYSTPDIVPWDWAHRLPPLVARTDKPYVTTCPTETVTVPDGRGGQGQVNVTRCY